MLTVLLAALAAAPETASTCEFREPKAPPKFEVQRLGSAEVTFSADPKWFNCAKKTEGASLEVVFTAGETEPYTPVVTRAARSYGFRGAAHQRDICALGPGLKKVRAEIRGTGELAKLAWTSEVGEVYCQRCEFRGFDNMFAVHQPGSFLSAKGYYTVEGTLDARWFECARAGSTLSLHVYAAQTQVEAREMKEPTHRIRGFESTHFKKRIDQKTLCKGKPKWIGYELHGTGEFSVLNGRGRSVSEARCP